VDEEVRIARVARQGGAFADDARDVARRQAWKLLVEATLRELQRQRDLISAAMSVPRLRRVPTADCERVEEIPVVREMTVEGVAAGPGREIGDPAAAGAFVFHVVDHIGR